MAILVVVMEWIVYWKDGVFVYAFNWLSPPQESIEAVAGLWVMMLIWGSSAMAFVAATISVRVAKEKAARSAMAKKEGREINEDAPLTPPSVPAAMVKWTINPESWLCRSYFSFWGVYERQICLYCFKSATMITIYTFWTAWFLLTTLWITRVLYGFLEVFYAMALDAPGMLAATPQAVTSFGSAVISVLQGWWGVIIGLLLVCVWLIASESRLARFFRMMIRAAWDRVCPNMGYTGYITD